MGIIATAEVQWSTRSLSARRNLAQSRGRRKHNLELLYYCWAVFTLLEFYLEDYKAWRAGQFKGPLPRPHVPLCDSEKEPRWVGFKWRPQRGGRGRTERQYFAARG
jgi:hypothetical protein